MTNSSPILSFLVVTYNHERCIQRCLDSLLASIICISINVTLYLKDGGTLAIMLRDSKTGEVMSTYYTMGQAKLNYTKTLIVPANSTLQVTLQYVLVACSYGNVNHWITLE